MQPCKRYTASLIPRKGRRRTRKDLATCGMGMAASHQFAKIRPAHRIQCSHQVRELVHGPQISGKFLVIPSHSFDGVEERNQKERPGGMDLARHRQCSRTWCSRGNNVFLEFKIRSFFLWTDLHGVLTRAASESESVRPSSSCLPAKMRRADRGECFVLDLLLHVLDGVAKAQHRGVRPSSSCLPAKIRRC